MAGCQTRLAELPVDVQDWRRDIEGIADVQQQPNAIPFWSYAGKVGIKIDGDSEQANLTWRHQQQHNQVRLFGPLGSGAVKLEFDNHRVQLTDNKGQTYEGDNAQQLLSDVVGWPLPVNALMHWLFARPAPDAVFQYRLNDEGQLSALQQLDWQIDYQDWRDYQGRLLPRKILAQKLNPTQHRVISVRLVTKSWQWQ